MWSILASYTCLMLFYIFVQLQIIMENIEKYSFLALDWLVKALPGLILALAVLIVGLWVIKKLSAILKVTLQKSGLRPKYFHF